MCIDVDNQSEILLDSIFLEQLESIFLSVLEDLGLGKKECELLLVDNAKIQAINLEFRGIDKVTDVLSFPLESEFSSLLGSVVISTQYAQKVANALGHSLKDEIALLFIHAILHLVGFNHEVDSGEHREKEAELVERFCLPTSLIVRTQGEKM
ncbi:rRNA maturation RNase YbeY [Helicobacter turcicus]|uniref:Endoribonuclease YbeY n=1 Tax=Helicobacter turcicus TaxID=2867412 RepID=A0ABS7JMR5_9HELI|nr:rRNA maturation RNase YbeY [Helicobacter turcicus]MBX7490670.1 rRNA maturation RNase YbeY [Helicobacter turcicus]MBX7545422.1 rRNA maturation RNase YbeY [Helicobacter turcicus]